MAEFVKGNHLNSKLDEILEKADDWLVLISPFIKFHSRIKEILLTKKNNDKLAITVVFGKNEESKQRSFSKDDFDFLSEFPNVEIKYEPRLHAKYYANEAASLLSSMNLYEYSQNNNIEFGIYADSKFLNTLIKSSDVDGAANEYFSGVVENSELMFQKIPVYEDKLLGLKKKYVRSEIEVDKLSTVYGSISKISNISSINAQELKEEVTKIKSEKTIITKNDPKTKEVQSAGKLLSASKIAAKYGSSLTSKKVQALMEDKGYLNGDEITDSGAELGLVKKSYMGNNYIAYPEGLDVFEQLK